MTIKKEKNHFTLIELLIVVGIIAVLSSVVVAGTSAARAQARDNQRKADLAAYQNALQLYFNDHKSYPLNNQDCNVEGNCLATQVLVSLVNEGYLESLPVDPRNSGQFQYRYSATDGSNYKLYVALERDTEAMKNDGGIDDTAYEVFSTLGYHLAVKFPLVGGGASFGFECDVKTVDDCSATEGGVNLMKLSNIENAHAELLTQTNYNDDYCVCCTGPSSVIGLGNNCNGSNNKVFIKLSDATNAHVKEDENTVTPLSPWLTNWNYRKAITINNTSATDFSSNGYQVLLTVDTSSLISSGKMQSGCQDIRFVDFNGGNLNYWIESGCNTTSTKIWVKVPLPAASQKTIYMYYGNNSAPAASNGSATFVFFDDAETGSASDKWQGSYGSINFSYESGGYLSLKSLRVNSSSSGGIIAKNVNINNAAFEAYVRSTNPYNMLTARAQNNCNMYWARSNNPPAQLGKAVNCSYTVLGEGAPSDPYYWSKWTIRANGPAIEYLINDSLRAGGGDSTFSSGSIGAGVMNGGSIFLDFVRVRQYTSPEPTISIAEEEPFYPEKACISANNGVNINCAYREGQCQSGEIILFSISDTMNAHVGNKDAYNIKVCCKLGQ